MTQSEDRSRIRAGSGPQVLATLRNTALNLHRLDGHTNIARAQRRTAWRAGAAIVPDRRDVYAPAPVSQDPLGPWKTLNAMLAENPPPPQHALLLNQFCGLGVGPGLDVEAAPAAVRQGLIRAAVVGMALLKQQFTNGEWATVINGWRYPPSEAGRFGNDFLRRAADQSLAGIAANDPAESVYLLNFSGRRRGQARPSTPLHGALQC